MSPGLHIPPIKEEVFTTEEAVVVEVGDNIPRDMDTDMVEQDGETGVSCKESKLNEQMPMTKAEKQKAYRDRKKQQEGESYLEKERQRTKAYYVPIADRSKTDQEKRRKKVRKLVQKHRERNRQSTIEPSTSQPSQQVESTSQEQEQVVSSSTDNPISTPLVVRLPCQNPKNRTRKRISRQVAKCNREIERLKGENINTQRKYKTVSKRYERLVKRTTQNKPSENVGQDKETGNDTHGNDGPSSSKSGIEKLTPRKRTYKELRDEGLSPSKIPKIVKNKLVLANLLTDEIEDVITKVTSNQKLL
ncbi:splicing regulatory glutamine/lysine-rich protein 1-like [Mytilus edulis]|uniref:splicing regulatory glutamine/lysine-rich protein 1-like n=1 Tax=Mytilus edulis TaxID=6550 RepID=UPI0039EE5469